MRQLSLNQLQYFQTPFVSSCSYDIRVDLILFFRAQTDEASFLRATAQLQKKLEALCIALQRSVDDIGTLAIGVLIAREASDLGESFRRVF